MRIRILAILAAFAGCLAAAPAWAQQDAKGGNDHPLVTRMPGFYIDSYEVEEFAAFDPTVIGGAEAHWEGKKYTIAYSLKEGATPVSMLQIARNYQNAMKAAGGRILGGDERRVATELHKAGAVTGVYVEAFNGGGSYSVTIVEGQAMRQDVTADAAAMGKDIAATGKTIVYGIHFASGSAAIKTDSAPAIAEMAKLLKDHPALRAYIVGHTDNVGAHDVNLKLSAERADALVEALVERGIALSRLKAAGVGPYCPIGSNGTDQGRAQNRRVELVEQ